MSKYTLGYVCFPQDLPVFKAQMALAMLGLITTGKFAVVAILSHVDYKDGYDIQIVATKDSNVWVELDKLPRVIQSEDNAGTDYWPQ